jgi:hypothetical protein
MSKKEREYHTLGTAAFDAKIEAKINPQWDDDEEFC